ncbi:MAG: LCP family protein [Pseudoclavibacter sp.]
MSALFDTRHTLPLRDPDTSSPDVMTRRAWWLLLTNLIVPGTAQVLAGNRRFGRFMLRLWLVGLGLIALLVLLGLIFRAPLVFLVFVVCWIVSQLDALRLTRLVKLDALARPLIGIIGVVLAFIPAIVGIGAINVTAQVQSTVSTLFGGPKAGIALPSGGRINVMMLGGDTGEDREGTRPDSISVMSFDVLTGRSVSIGIPRALEEFPFSEGPMQDKYPNGYGNIQGCEVDVCYLNSVYTEVELVSPEMYPDAESHGSLPGIEATRDAVEGITGLDIHYYVFVDMAGFAGLIDALGGVEINVTERVGIGINDDGSEGWQPATEWIEPGLQTMDGSTALWYARSRYETTDFERMARQRELQAALIAKFTPAVLLSRLGPVLDAAENIVVSDMPQGMAGLVADLLLRSRSQPNTSLDLVPPLVEQGAPDIDMIHQMVQDSFDAEPEPEPGDTGTGDSG